MSVISIIVEYFTWIAFENTGKHIQLVTRNCEIIPTEATYFRIFLFFNFLIFSPNYGDFQMSNNDLIQYD